MAKRTSSVPEAISASLLGLAESLEQQGKIHQSLDPYLKLVERYPDSQEAPLAAQRLLAIAENFRQASQHHMALRVLERLEVAYPDA
jgi:TolA-binding protein